MIRKCKLCGEVLVNDEEVWRHLVFNHKKEIMKLLEPVFVKCEKCKKYFRVIPEPVYSNGLKFVVPVWCKKCSLEFYGFIVDYIPEEKSKSKP